MQAWPYTHSITEGHPTKRSTTHGSHNWQICKHRNLLWFTQNALVHPLLKKINLDLLDKNYHPVSNLSFLSKAIECKVASQLVEYVESNDLMEPNKSAYRRSHNIETTLLKIKSDILKVMDGRDIVCLLLLDLSAAFDTVDHTILLDDLQKLFCHWWSSFSMDRFIPVKQNTMYSTVE